MKNDTSLNILISYAYFTSKKFQDFVEREVKRKTINIMIDSGAFTKHNAKKESSHINVDMYCEFLSKWKDLCEKYVMLDVVGNAEQSRKNYEYMLKRGLNPMFVATMFDKDFDYLNYAVSNNPDVCVAGGVTTKNDWMTKRFQDIYKETNEKIRIHGLGYVIFPKMLQLPLVSVDSSSWKTGPCSYGQIMCFKEKKTEFVFYVDLIKGKKEFPLFLKQQCNKYGITPTMFFNKKNHTGTKSISFFLSMINYLRLQKYCKLQGLDLFIAASSLRDIKSLIFLDKNIDSVKYDDYLKFISNEN